MLYPSHHRCSSSRLAERRGGGDCAERARVLAEGGEIDGCRLSGFLEVARAFSNLAPATGRKPAGLSGVPALSMQPLQPGDEFILIRATAAAATIASSPAPRRRDRRRCRR